MTTGVYSFIDIAVLDGVRGHFTAGDPLVMLSEDLNTILWVNGSGADLLGHENIETALGSSPKLGTTVSRQIRATPGFPHIGKGRPLTIRINSGLSSIPLSCNASSVRLPDGRSGILLAVGGRVPAGMDEDKIAEQAISGLCKPGHHAALLNADGGVIYADAGFVNLNLASGELRDLIREVAGENDRLVKRMVRAGVGDIAAGIGRLADEPAVHLLIVVVAEADEMPAGTEPRYAGEPTNEQVEAPNRDLRNDAAATEPTELPESEPVTGFVRHEQAKAEFDATGTAEESDQTAETQQESPVQKEGGSDYANATTEMLSAPQSGQEAVRFVWRTDSEGCFSAISQEFADTVGTEMADVIGRPFTEVANTLGIDPDGDIAGLLARRDTWSGKSVMWPVAGAGRRVTVDLAALPAYSRERIFEGFRGFGVVRLSETTDDLAVAGISLTTKSKEETELEAGAATQDGTAVDTSIETDDIDPFLGEKPAIQIESTPERRDSDKVIRLAAHRQGSLSGALSENEETAFREIGEQLKDESGLKNEKADTDDRQDDDITKKEDREPAEITGRLPDNQNANEPLGAVTDFIPSAFASPSKAENGGADVSVLEQLPVAILIRSGDQLHFANPEFLRLTGYTSLRQLDEAGGFDVLFAGPDQFSEDDGGDPKSAMRLVTRDGAEKLCEAHLRSVRWDDHRALMLTIRPSPVISPPIDGSDPIGEDLNERIQELTAILDTATDGVVLVTSSGAIRSLNHSAEALFGFDSADLLGKQFSVLFAIESQRTAADYLSGLSDNGVASVLNDGREIIGREARGRFIPLFMTMGRLPGERGYCAVLRDITSWKRAEEELTQARGQAEQASSLKTDFLAKISHEIRTPLNAIIGFSELMLDEKFGPIDNARYRDYLRDINNSGNHVLDLVNDLLDISKIEAGEQELEFGSVSLNDALADTVALMQPDANRERVIIRSSFASNLPDVVADLRSVKQIALNLLSNAIKFTPAGGQVIVSTVYQRDGNVVMRVRDTGIGMSRPEIDQAMKPFKQVRSMRSRRGDGTGLGLPLTKAMVEANRAGFTIESTPDEGTIIEITFPSTRVLAD